MTFHHIYMLHVATNLTKMFDYQSRIAIYYFSTHTPLCGKVLVSSQIFGHLKSFFSILKMRQKDFSRQKGVVGFFMWYTARCTKKITVHFTCLTVN